MSWTLNHRFPKPALFGALGMLLALGACGVAASRVPLGGNYAITEGPLTRDRSAASSAPIAAAISAPEPEPSGAASSALNAAAAPPSVSAASSSSANPNLIRYQPLKIGDSVKVDANVSFELALEAGPHAVIPGDGKLSMQAQYRFELKVSNASAQTLDELDVTVTPLALHTRYGEHAREAPLAGPEKFHVKLGRSPSVQASSGSSSDEEGRAVLLLLCTALADFHERWLRSPSLELSAGWSSKSPVTVPPALNGHGEAWQVGPFLSKYTAPDATDAVRFEVALPVSYAGAIAKLDFDLKGNARLSRTQARPLALELSGPANGGGGPHGELRARGFTKLSATFSYQ